MYANNEVGSINEIMELVAVVKEVAPKAHFHTDAVQLLGKYSLEWIGKSQVDSASFSGHKIGAYKGVGALFLKSANRLALFMAGGGQERGRRPGTENIPGILSFGLRCQEIRGKELAATSHMQEVRRTLVEGISSIRGGHVHGASHGSVLPNTVHFHLEEVPGDDILLNFDLEGIQVSSGSACSSGSARPSHVVLALGFSEWVAVNSIRVSFSHHNSYEDAQRIVKVLEQVALRVRGYLS
jgi:cysteine desulfurase